MRDSGESGGEHGAGEDDLGAKVAGRAASACTPEPPRRAKRPWWLPHFLGRVPIGLDARYVNLVGLVALASLFENYDLSVLSSAMKQIREGFGLEQGAFTSLMAWTRLGAVPGFFVLPIADRFGRRRVFLGAIVGMSVGTVLSAFAPTAASFVALQTLTRSFVIASMATAVVIVAEELPARHRGWGIGLLGAIGSLGYGLGALLYAFVDVLPGGWRALYLAGCAPLFLLPMFRRRIPETGRFLSMRSTRAAGDGSAAFFGPMFELLRAYPARSLGVAAMATSVALGSSPAFTLLSDFVQTTHGWTPSAYSTMAILAGMFGIVGNPAMGWAADRFGRRPVAMAGFGLFPVAAFALYFGPSMAVPIVWVPFVFLLTGANVLMRIIASELFPRRVATRRWAGRRWRRRSVLRLASSSWASRRRRMRRSHRPPSPWRR
ncbi:MAG: MFS transporter [Myxococcota bacterium]